MNDIEKTFRFCMLILCLLDITGFRLPLVYVKSSQSVPYFNSEIHLLIFLGGGVEDDLKIRVDAQVTHYYVKIIYNLYTFLIFIL